MLQKNTTGPFPTNSFFERAAEKVLQNVTNETPISVYVVGSTGAGKSSTVNTLLCAKRAHVSDHDVGTLHVRPYAGFWRTLPFIVYDTPGFGDALEEKGNDQRYIDEIAAIPTPADVVLCVFSLSEQRPDNEIYNTTLRLIVNYFSNEFLMRSLLFVLTRADKYEHMFIGALTSIYRQFAREASLDCMSATAAPVVRLANPLNPETESRSADQLWLQIVGRTSRLNPRTMCLCLKSAQQ